MNEIHTQGEQQARFLLGDYAYVEIQDGSRAALREELFKLSSQFSGKAIIVGLPLSSYWQALEFMIGLFMFSKLGAPRLLLKTMEAIGGGVQSSIVIMPNLASPRFFFPYGEKIPHAFLSQHILAPRQYALSGSMRFAMKLYIWLVRYLSRPVVLYRAAYCLVKFP